MQAWEKFLNLQEAELGAETVQKWLRPLKVVRFDAGNLYLQANDSFQILWFEEHIRKKANAALANNNGRRIKVHLALVAEPSSSKKNKTKKEQNQPAVSSKSSIAFDALDPHCTFDNFVPPVAQMLPYKLLLQTTGWQQTKDKAELAAFNPIYLCGPVGTGKTHLLMATAHVLRSQGVTVIYVRAETFTEHVVTAIRAGEMDVFRQSYRNIDALIIDDVHIFGKKWATQEELFHTFNTLHLAGKQIILSANCLPGELHFVEPRLISRFEWGIVLPLERPQKEEIRDILRTRASALKFALNPAVADFLVETFASSPKALTKALEALILRLHVSATGSRISSTQLTVTFAQHLLTDLIKEEHDSKLNASQIIQQVAEYFGIRAEDILGKAQTRDCVLPRQIAMHLCRIKLKMPFTKIGDLFCKDHSTVISSVKVIQKSLDGSDKDICGPHHTILKTLR